MHDTLIVFNPVAGQRHRGLFERVMARLAKRGVHATVRETGDAGDARRFAEEAASGVGTIVVAGGDGTINEVVNGLAAREGGAPDLALLPMGTANVLAAEIGFDRLTADGITDAIADGAARRVYLGRANERYFALMCGVGFDAHVVANVSLRLKRRFGKLAYVVASLAEIRRYVAQRYLVTVDGRFYEAASVVVANGHYYGGRFSCVPQARIGEPGLYACLFMNTGRWHVLRYAWGLLSGRLAQFRDVLVLPAMTVAIESVGNGSRHEPVQGDGDIIGTLPVIVSGGAAQLTMRCPQ